MPVLVTTPSTAHVFALNEVNVTLSPSDAPPVVPPLSEIVSDDAVVGNALAPAAAVVENTSPPARISVVDETLMRYGPAVCTVPMRKLYLAPVADTPDGNVTVNPVVDDRTRNLASAAASVRVVDAVMVITLALTSATRFSSVAVAPRTELPVDAATVTKSLTVPSEL